jgi:hypothetical protein
MSDYSPVVEPVVVRPLTACQMLDCGITRLYELINSNELESFADGRRRYVTVKSIHRYVADKLATDEKAPAASFEKAVAASVLARSAAPRTQSVPSATRSWHKTRTAKRKLTPRTTD